jgi:hypothetical protein
MNVDGDPEEEPDRDDPPPLQTTYGISQISSIRLSPPLSVGRMNSISNRTKSAQQKLD